MADELALFFAKKASKTKKKGVIRLQEVAENLERHERIQDELDEVEAKIKTEPSTTKHSNNDNEDSEWLDFDDKPILPPVIKEMADVDIEMEEEEDRSSSEPVKTWNFNTENIEVSNIPVTPLKVKYEPKAASRAKHNPLDLNNVMSFPSLGDAANVEKKLKKEEEENILRELEEKKMREEKEQQQKLRYEAPRSEFKHTKTTSVPNESDDTDNWRSAAPPPEPPKTMNAERKTFVQKTIPERKDNDNWRNAPPPEPTKTMNSERQPFVKKIIPESNDSDNWRRAPPPTEPPKNPKALWKPSVKKTIPESKDNDNWRSAPSL